MNLAVIGAAGIMGSYSARALAPRAEKLLVYDSKPRAEIEAKLDGLPYAISDTPADAVRDANIVLFCVPTHLVQGVMHETLPHCKRGALITGQTSRKEPETRAFDEYNAKNPESRLEMVTIHTMCDPSKSEASREILGIIKHCASEKAYTRAYDFFSPLSNHVEEFATIDEHDTAVAYTQINVSRTFLSIASSFAAAGCFPWLSGNYGSSFDSMKFALAMRAASAQPHIYKGIQFGSRHGNHIVSTSLAIEHELYRLVVGNEKEKYQDILCEARERLFGEHRRPLLTDEDMKFRANGAALPNSDFSIMQWIASYAALNRDIHEDFKATTPMHRALYCLADRLCNTERFEEALEAPFEISSLRADDLVFDRQINGWSEALLYENEESYESRHAAMRARLDSSMLAREVEKSKGIIGICRTRFDDARARGRL